MRWTIVPLLLLSVPATAQSTREKSPYNATVMRNGDRDMGYMRNIGGSAVGHRAEQKRTDGKECLYHRKEFKIVCMTQAEWIEYAANMPAAEK